MKVEQKLCISTRMSSTDNRNVLYFMTNRFVVTPSQQMLVWLSKMNMDRFLETYETCLLKRLAINHGKEF